MSKSRGNHFDSIWDRKLSSATGTEKNVRVEKAASLLTNGNRLLDIGCGDGSLGVLAQLKYRETYGIDIAQKAVEISVSKGIKASVFNFNEGILPYENQYFDTVTCLAALQYLYDPIFVFEEVCRVMKKGGTFIFTVPNMRAFWRIYRLAILGKFPKTSLDPEGYDGGALHYFCSGNLIELGNHTGFRFEKIAGIFSKPAFLQSILNQGLFSRIKAEFFSGELLCIARKQ